MCYYRLDLIESWRFRHLDLDLLYYRYPSELNRTGEIAIIIQHACIHYVKGRPADGRQ